MIMNKLPQNFFLQNTVDVAKSLIGAGMFIQGKFCLISEVEAYRGADDEASHAFCGYTKRNVIMFGPPGYIYVYMIYGIHHCFNIVTEKAGVAGAVLIRGVAVEGTHLNGPGKLCRYLNLTRAHNGLCCTEDSPFLFTLKHKSSVPFDTTERIGIKKAQDKLWRFVATPPTISHLVELSKNHSFVESI